MPILLLCIILGFTASDALSGPSYTLRSSGYSGYQTTLRGDINSVGMAGANVALPTNVSSSETNPAGGAMMMGSVAAQIIRNSIHDGYLTDGDQKIKSTIFGISITTAGWAGSYSSFSPSHEVSGDYQVIVREHHFAASRLFLKKKLSLGIAPIFVSTTEKSDVSSQGNMDFLVQIGALYRTTDRLNFGTTFRPGYSTTPHQEPSTVGEFFQPVKAPWIWSQGASWYPNRIFKAGVSMVIFGKTTDTALLKDQSTTGKEITYQPRLGASYIFGDFKKVKMEFSTGSYWESAILGGGPARLHQTAGLQINPYFVNTGIGIDRAKGYRNLMVSVGIDIVRTLRVLDIIPKEYVRPQQRFFPNPFDSSCKGLPEGMCDEKRRKNERPPSLGDIQKIIENIPEAIEKKIE